MAKRDYYEVLGVTRKVEPDELKKTYRKLAMKFHPDKNPNDKKAEDRFKELSEAYDVLSDPQKKAAYDQYGHMGTQGGGFKPGANPFEGFGGFQRGARPAGGAGFGGGPGAGGFDPNSESFQDVFGDIFGDMFGAGGRRGPSSGAGTKTSARARGADLKYTLNISFEEAALGSEKTISFVRHRGGKEESAKLSVTVPAGVKPSQRLKLTGEGDAATGGGAVGDLYVIIHILDHPLFKRVENDIYLDLPISFVDATLGMTAEVPTLTGKASLKIPPGTPSGQIFRLRGKGFTSVAGSESGDMLVKVQIDVPRELSDAEKDSLRRFSASLTDTPLVKSYQEKVDRLFKAKK